MKKFFKVSILLLLSMAILAFTIPCNVRANETQNTKVDDLSNSLQNSLNYEEKIMCYDAITNETTEVNMEELCKTLESRSLEKSNNLNGSNIPSTLPAIEPSNTFLNSHKPKDFGANLYASSTVIGTRITNTSTHPYVSTCRIKSSNYNGTALNRYATAAVVAPKAVLTAAHCVFDKDNGNQTLKKWSVCAGYNYLKYYGTETGWSKVYYSDVWMKTHDNTHDWAICVLGDDLGKDVGCYRC